MKYPKLAAAIDDLLSKLVRENGEAFVQFAVDSALASAPEPVPEKLPPIPVTKESPAFREMLEEVEARHGG